MARAADRECARLRKLVDRYHDGIWRALRRLGVPTSQADDASQRVFLIASTKISTIRADGERQYLYGIAVRVASGVRRGLARRREIGEDHLEANQLEGGPPQPDELLESKRRIEQLDGWLTQMPHDLREAFVLFEIQELTATEVATILAVPVGTVASRVRRARAFLRARYDASRGAEDAMTGRQP